MHKSKALYCLSDSKLAFNFSEIINYSKEIAQAFIKRIEAVNPTINAIHQFDPERILREARQKDQEIADGKKLGKLHGLPVSLKDGIYSPGLRGAKGNIALYNSSPTDKAATAVQRL